MSRLLASTLPWEVVTSELHWLSDGLEGEPTANSTVASKVQNRRRECETDGTAYIDRQYKERNINPKLGTYLWHTFNDEIGRNDKIWSRSSSLRVDSRSSGDVRV